jgi:hypothetical protein
MKVVDVNMEANCILRKTDCIAARVKNARNQAKSKNMRVVDTEMKAKSIFMKANCIGIYAKNFHNKALYKKSPAKGRARDKKHKNQITAYTL